MIFKLLVSAVVPRMTDCMRRLVKMYIKWRAHNTSKQFPAMRVKISKRSTSGPSGFARHGPMQCGMVRARQALSHTLNREEMFWSPCSVAPHFECEHNKFATPLLPELRVRATFALLGLDDGQARIRRVHKKKL